MELVSNPIKEKVLLLREAVELVMREHDAICSQTWGDLLKFREQKKDLASRMASYEWVPGPEDETEPEIILLSCQVIDLEYQCWKKLRVQMKIKEAQIHNLKRRHFEWMSCLQAYQHVCYG